jgi:hypothetical protein
MRSSSASMGKKGVVVAAGVLAVITVMSGAISAVYMALVRTTS